MLATGTPSRSTWRAAEQRCWLGWGCSLSVNFTPAWTTRPDSSRSLMKLDYLFRTSERNIGIAHWEIPVAVSQVLADITAWC